MITDTKNLEIERFLASKKLQSDLFVEVQDHFISQISQLMLFKNIGFEEAFLQTKILWMGELRMVKASIISFKRITVIEKKIVDKRLNKVLLNSFLLLSLIFGLQFLFPDFNVFITIFLFLILIMLVGLSLIKKKLKFRDYLFLGFHPLLLKVFVIGLLFQFIITPILTGFFTPKELGIYMSNNFFLSTLLAFMQIQLLYLNFKNKKVLL